MIKFAFTVLGIIAFAFLFNICEVFSEVSDWINDVNWEEILWD